MRDEEKEQPEVIPGSTADIPIRPSGEEMEAKLQEQGIDVSTQLGEVFIQKARRGKHQRR